MPNAASSFPAPLLAHFCQTLCRSCIQRTQSFIAVHWKGLYLWIYLKPYNKRTLVFELPSCVCDLNSKIKPENSLTIGQAPSDSWLSQLRYHLAQQRRRLATNLDLWIALPSNNVLRNLKLRKLNIFGCAQTKTRYPSLKITPGWPFIVSELTMPHPTVTTVHTRLVHQGLLARRLVSHSDRLVIWRTLSNCIIFTLIWYLWFMFRHYLRFN